MSKINIKDLTFCYEGSYDNIFSDVSLSIDTDWRLGFCGRNGRGKTTLLKLLMNEYEYSGTISSNVKFDYFPIKVRNKENFTIDILQEIAPDIEYWQIQKELNKLEVDDEVLYRPFNTLSNGEQTKVLLSALFLKSNNFLLIDEPTNHLDMRARQVVANYLKSKSAFILVSHDRAFLDDCVDHILSLNKNGIEIIAGNFSTYSMQKERQDAFEISQNEKLETEIERLKRAVEKTAQWSEKAEKGKFGTLNSGLKVDRGYVGHKAAKMMKRSKVIEKRQNDSINEKSNLLKNIERSLDLKLEPLKYHSERLISMSNISIFYDEKQVLNNFNLNLNQGQRISINGGNGSGKSSILKLICGEKNIPFSGEMNIASRLIISYVAQDTSFLKGDLSDFAQKNNIDESLFKSMLHKLDFSRTQLEKDIKDLSAGQKKKVLIAKSLCERANVYVWDEPLNYIDILSRIQIEDLILTYKPTMIFVEHDRAFCDKIATDTYFL